MVTNSFGKRKLMQPIGRPKHALKVPCFFFLLSKLGGGGFFFLNPWFLMCSHYVTFNFPMGPISFPICSSSSLCVPQHVLHSTSFLFHMLWQMLPFFHIERWAKRGGTLYFKIKPSI